MIQSEMTQSGFYPYQFQSNTLNLCITGGQLDFLLVKCVQADFQTDCKLVGHACSVSSWFSISLEVGRCPLFLVLIGLRMAIELLEASRNLANVMTHPLIPQIIEIAAPVAATLGLDVVAAVFQTNQHPPVLRVDVRNLEQDTGLNDCERMSHALEAALDAADVIPDAYVLEISSPGISRSLTSDREFISFKGFPVVITTDEPHAGSTSWAGQLVRRDETAVYLSQKGRSVVVPRSLIKLVQLVDRV